MANGNIDQLNFEVILDDKKFNQQIERDLKAASELNTKLSAVLNMKKRLNNETTEQITNAEKAKQAEQKTAQEMAKTALAQEKVRTQAEKTATAQRMHTGAVAQTNAALLNTTSIMRTLSQLTGATFSVIGMRRFLSSLIDITGQFEVQKMSLRNMLQDVSAADRIFRQLYDFSTESTYRFSELAKYAKQLAGFQIGKDDLLETTKMLGDVASGLGVSMDRLILAYGHVKSSGFLRGIQLRSFSQNGVPILKELSDMFTEIEGKAVSMGDVFDKMTKREIPFEMVEEAFRRMTSEGGQFYRMQEVLAKTLAGQINILKGKWENAMYAIGESNDKWLKGGVQILTSMVNHIQEIGAALKPVIAGFGAYGAALAAAQMGTWIAGAARAVTTFIQLARATSLATAMVTAFGTATKAVAASLGVLSALTVVVVSMVQATGRAKRELDEFNHSLDEIHKTARDTSAYDAEISKIDSLRKIVDNANNSYDARKAALDQLKQIVPDYHADLTEEGRLINNNKAALDKYIEALNREAKMKGAQDELAELYKKRREIAEEVNKAQEVADKAPVAPSRSVASVNPLAAVSVMGNAANANRNLDVAKQKLQSIDNQIDSINKELAETIGHVGPESPGQYNVASIIEGIKKYDADIKKIRDLAKKGTISAEQKDALDSLIAQREEQAKLYEDIMGVKYDKDNKAKRGESLDMNAMARQSLQADVRVLEKYKSAYDKLEPIFGDQTAPQLEKIFGKVTDFNNLDAAIEKLIADLRALGDEKSIDAADSIEASLGLDKVSEILKVQKAIEQQKKALDSYQKTLQKWQKDYGGRFAGFDAELDEVVVDYFNELQKIDNEYVAAQEEIYEAYKDNVDAIKEETDALYELYKARRQAAYGNADLALNALAQKHAKDATSSLDLSDWGDKSIAQVFGIYKALGQLAEDSLSGGLKIGDGVSEELKKAGLSVEDFSKLSYDEFKKLEKNAKEELLKKLGATLKEVAGDILDVASSFGEWAKASGNLELSERISDLQELGSIISSVAQRALQGDWIGAVTAGVAGIAKSILSAKTEIAEFESTLRALNEEARRTQFENILSSGIDSVFGANNLKKVENAVSALAKARASMREYLSDIASMDFNTTKKGFWSRFFGSTARAAAGDRISVFNKSSIEEMAKAVGGDLYDSYGNLNANTLKTILENYENLDAAQREWIEHAITDSEAYANAMEQLDSVIESLFGDMVSSVADRMVDSWWEAGQAALDYADILGDVAKAYAKLIVQDMLMETAFDKDREDALKDAFKNGDASKAMQIVTEAMESAESMLPAVEAALQAFEPYRNLSSDSSDGASSVGSGIKSITEDTANLLASYLNAIRADVSYMRVMQEKGWADVAAIAEAVASPTLNDYVAQIAASNYDIAQSNQRILSELQSVIGAPGTSGMVVRVESN